MLYGTISAINAEGMITLKIMMLSSLKKAKILAGIVNG